MRKFLTSLSLAAVLTLGVGSAAIAQTDPTDSLPPATDTDATDTGITSDVDDNDDGDNTGLWGLLGLLGLGGLAGLKRRDDRVGTMRSGPGTTSL